MMYSLNEISLIPAVTSEVSSRGEVCCTYANEDKLPIFVAPMTSLIDMHNFHIYEKSNFQVIMPIWYDNYSERMDNLMKGNWTALTLDEFIHIFCAVNIPEDDTHYHVLIDCANGHMIKLLQAARDAKQEFGFNLTIMAGNLATPETYIHYCEAGVDYCRLGIGGNVVCETGSLTGFHTSLPWLLTEINKVKEKYPIKPTCKIIADGGVNSISKIIKCLALGADYVMCGYMFSQVDSVARNTKKVPVTDTFSEIHNLYYGQASVQGQLDRFGPRKDIQRVEGSETYVPVKYANLSMLENEIRKALESAMSYADAFTLEEFVGNVRWEIQSPEEYKSFNA